MSSDHVKRLPLSVAADIMHKNAARLLAGLDTIKIEVKTCAKCGGRFESTGAKCCGCDGCGGKP